VIQPGCFGAPSVFSFNSRVCGKCGQSDECQKAAHAALLAAPVHLVGNLLREHEEYCRRKATTAPEGSVLATTLPAPVQKQRKAVRFPITDVQEELLRSLPKKVGDYLRKLMVRGIDREVLEAAGVGKNAFSVAKHRPYALALNMLFEGGMTKQMLRVAFCEELGWSDVASYPQVSMIWHLFPAMGLAEEQGCSLIASSAVKTRNTV